MSGDESKLFLRNERKANRILLNTMLNLNKDKVMMENLIEKNMPLIREDIIKSQVYFQELALNIKYSFGVII